MKLIDLEFQSNPNSSGIMTFKQICRGISTTTGKPVYIYQRITKNNTTYGYEVFIPLITKAGTIQKFPTGVTRTIEDDTEEYPGASAFGRYAWFCTTLDQAQSRFNQIVNKTVDVPDIIEHDITEPVAITNSVKHHGRARNERPILVIPTLPFSVKELAEQNKVEYHVAAVFVKEAIGYKLKLIRSERRNTKGKLTNIYSAI